MKQRHTYLFPYVRTMALGLFTLRYLDACLAYAQQSSMEMYSIKAHQYSKMSVHSLFPTSASPIRWVTDLRNIHVAFHDK